VPTETTSDSTTSSADPAKPVEAKQDAGPPESKPDVDAKTAPAPDSNPLEAPAAVVKPALESQAPASPDAPVAPADTSHPASTSQPAEAENGHEAALPPSERKTEKLPGIAEILKPWTATNADDPTIPRPSALPQTAQLNPDLIDTLRDKADEPRPIPPPPDPTLIAGVAAAVTAAAKASGVDLNNSNNDDTVRPAPRSNAPTERLPAIEKIVPGVSTGITCPNCKHQNRPGELICDHCGTSLISGGRAALGTRDLVREQEARPDEKLLDTDARQALELAGGSAFTESMALRLEIESGNNPMVIYPKSEIVLGRRDPNTGAIPDVDLTAYAGYRLGVSRRHSIIRMQEKALFITDLGSSNGTFLNGTRLAPHRPHQLRDGDEVRLGQMALRLYFQTGRR
jgi:hypothetical protein